MYSEILIDHFSNPRNLGWLLENDGAGMAGDPRCGDFVVICICVTDEKISDIRFQVKGCPAAVAVSSMLTTMALGQSLAKAEMIKPVEISNALGGLQPEKLHCSTMAVAALRQAISEYRGIEKS